MCFFLIFEKKWAFFSKNRAIFSKNVQNFGNQYKPPKYTSSPKFGWFEAFLAEKLQILSIFGPNFSLLIYKGMWRPAVIPCLTLSDITFEPLVRFQKSWAFWKALEKGYLMVSKRKNLKKKALPPSRALTIFIPKLPISRKFIYFEISTFF